MIKTLQLRLRPHDASHDTSVQTQVALALGIQTVQLNGFHILKQSFDARGKQVWVNLTVAAFIEEPFQARQVDTLRLQDVSKSANRVVVVGAGPAGLFAALTLIEHGIKPIIIERGKEVRKRRRDLAMLNKLGIVNPESNYCFGEGGAGTYSDGKLYTRSSKRGNIKRILDIFYQYGANESILYQSHPHIGTNKLPQIITNMREAIIDAGGEVHFETKLCGFETDGHYVKTIQTSGGESIQADAVILATGHSARDVFELLYLEKIQLEAKPFALGVRVEHPQEIIDQLQYHCETRDKDLPPASYQLVEQVRNKGVFSFCMCPGGIIAPAATSPGELVVNGWSPSKRNNPYANSGMVVTVDEKDAYQYLKHLKHPASKHQDAHPLILMYFQQAIEQTAFESGGGNFKAPAQRLVDFCKRKTSSSLPSCSYLPGIVSQNLNDTLPPFISDRLRIGFEAFGNKMRDKKNSLGFLTNEAVVVATESRTSSPVRIPRLEDRLHHPQLRNLYPCGEGAGYAGGIVSAAMDGERVARQIALVCSKTSLPSFGTVISLVLSVIF
jgi:hypothetical protein